MEMLKLGTVGDYCQEEHWEETCTDPISHIFVTFDTKSVTSIQYGYVRNGDLVLSKKYGSSEIGQSTRIVRLNHETEFVTGISGETYFSSFITSLTFHTNERKQEAFHAEFEFLEAGLERTEFHSGIRDRREFGGFFGSCCSYCLSSIGLYLKPVLSGVRIIKQENV